MFASFLQKEFLGKFEVSGVNMDVFVMTLFSFKMVMYSTSTKGSDDYFVKIRLCTQESEKIFKIFNKVCKKRAPHYKFKKPDDTFFQSKFKALRTRILYYVFPKNKVAIQRNFHEYTTEYPKKKILVLKVKKCT